MITDHHFNRLFATTHCSQCGKLFYFKHDDQPHTVPNHLCIHCWSLNRNPPPETRTPKSKESV